MARFPTTFTETVESIDPERLHPEGREALLELQGLGFDATLNARREDVTWLAGVSEQRGVREFCRNDLDKRFAGEPMMEAWYQKDDDGRAPILLRRLGDIAGHGWLGAAGADEREQIPGAETTFAERLHEAYAGRGLAVPFAKVIVWAGVEYYGARNITLETWGSNTKAVKTYRKAGAELVTTVDSWRPTLHDDDPGVVYDEEKGYYKRRDVRLFMRFGSTFDLQT